MNTVRNTVSVIRSKFCYIIKCLILLLFSGGIGPNSTCKHVVAVLLVLIEFKRSGLLKVAKSCTEKLASFNQPTVTHTGSPVRAESISKLTQAKDDDPRPLHMRNRPQYNDEVKMSVVSFCHASGMDIPMRYLFEKADLQAAILDHDYFHQPFTFY